MKAEYDQILKDLKNKVYQPVYFLQGEEPYFIDRITSYIEEKVLDDSEKEFNQVVLYGKDVDTLTVVDNAKRYPMMSNYSVVIVKEAQSIRGFGSSDNDPLLSYIKNPLKSTILVVNYKYKKLDGRTAFAKAVQKHSVFYTSKAIYENKVPDWIDDYVSKQSYSIQPKAALLIADYLGNKLSKVSNELDKLILNLKKGTKITVDHIEKYIGISKEYNVFELQTALGRRDLLKANRIVEYVKVNNKDTPAMVLLSTLYTYFAKLLKYQQFYHRFNRNELAGAIGVHPYFLTEYSTASKNYPKQKIVHVISWLRECDIKLKGVNNNSASQSDLLKELVFKILHV